jgi:hypothetical protein
MTLVVDAGEPAPGSSRRIVGSDELGQKLQAFLVDPVFV